MTKTFKKVIACLLAVLMACFSVPFTALATPDSYQPNLSMRFGTFSNSASSKDFTGTTTSSTLLKTGNDFSLSGIYTPQVDWEGTLNKENGSVNITKLYFDTSRLEAFMPSYDEEMTIDDYDGDLGEDTNGIIEYEEGMPFTLTFTLQNIKKIIGYGAFFTYTDNIAPAIVYQSGTKSSNLVTKLGTINDYNTDTTSKKAAVTPVNCAIEAQSSESFYEDTSGEPWECWKDVVNEGDGLFEFIGSSPYDADISTCNLVSEQEDIVDPVTNELGYDCANDAICVTFIFLVTGEISEEHPLTIGFQDYTSASAKNGSISCASDDTQLYDIDHCTYGPQEGATGSCHAYFMGYNANTGAYVDDGSYYNSYPWTDKDETPTEHTHTYGEYTHDENAETHSAYCTSGDGGKDTQDCTFELDADSSSSATCTENGKNVYKCTVCGYSYEEELTATGHSFTNYVENDDAVAATCTEDGKTASKTAKCDNNCGEEDTVEGTKIDATGHSFTNYVSNNDAVEATKKEAGKTASKTAKCDNNCGEEDTVAGEVIPALGYTITVLNTNGEASSDNYCDLNVQWGDNTANFGDKFTIDASAIEGGKVVGYKVNGRFVAGSTYSVTVSSDMTVQVITEDTSANVTTITATFLDMYNNVIKTVAGTVDEVRAELATVPTAPTYPGYTFVDWSITDDEIKNISESTTITANYEANATVGYTVTTSAELTLPEGVENGSIPYDSSVTVTDANATSWTVDGVTVAYGDTYTFFVGSDVTVQPAYDAVVTSGAATSIISKTLNADGVKVVFLATMDVADGYTLVDHGFIYGKNATDDELTLDNVGSAIAANSDAKVKATHAGATGSLQFGLNYGLSAKSGTANVKAYVIVKNSAGTLITIESAANGYTY
jgi:hypothetical protein